ncbi:MSMEG_0565 family glycosyltransferase [Lichenifustis flavocetrariae]|uniref:MSMEG_0565 family glycosyltransferase n=1 Tax=Lichenifustis flavocetrariae TaxID=2949735 RepID=A0AA41YZC9_9HYPH|nr:MSMEG_0565 family glycosyltransferase [Lichenifustis flavocetrariae]MCW6510914.1 MSMEG_0565 family glycosyltransferase [Lichenifustis flavocetrariae]
MTGRPLRIALLTHSTNPRGGVVHALAIGDALAELGHEAVVHAPDASGRGFFRATACQTLPIPASLLNVPDTHALVEARIDDYLRHFADPAHRRFDVFHAQDGISGNALATLKQRGLIEGFTRTVHHIESFADPRVADLQRRSIVEADTHVVVSPQWSEVLRDDFGLAATVIGNGVDRLRYSPHLHPEDLTLRRRLRLQDGPVFLSVGGIEERKNTVRILEAFAQVFALRPEAQLVIAGGSSLLDHEAYRFRFAEALAASGLPADAVRCIGPLADADMPALYRISDALVFPSVKEGFGLVVLEAMACGLPVVTSAIRPFTDYLDADDVVWCRPDSTASIANAMLVVLQPAVRARVIAQGHVVSARHDWHQAARAHLSIYQTVGALDHA